MSVQSDLIDLTLQAMRVIRRHYDATAQQMGITMARASVISAVSRDEGAAQGTIAAALEIEAPTLKRLVDALEKDGYVQRRGDPNDARKKTLHLTDRARDSEIAEFGRRLRSDAMEGIASADLITATDVMRRIAENLTRQGAK